MFDWWSEQGVWDNGGIKMVEVVDGWRSEMTLIWGFALTDVTISTCRFRRALQWMNR